MNPENKKPDGELNEQDLEQVSGSGPQSPTGPPPKKDDPWIDPQPEPWTDPEPTPASPRK